MTILEEIRAFMVQHRLSLPQMAVHAGVPPNTLKTILARGRIGLRWAEALQDALRRPPENREPRHASIVREHWGRLPSAKIGELAQPPISGTMVRRIAKQIGLTQRKESNV